MTKAPPSIAVPTIGSLARWEVWTFSALPPRQFTHLELRDDSLSKEAAVVLKGGGWKIEFVAERPGRPFFGILGRRAYRKLIASRPPYRDPFA